MCSALSVDQRLELITRGLLEEDIQGVAAIRAALEIPNKKPKCLWVTSPTGKPHVGYYIPLLKFADFLKADVEIFIVLLDVYSFLDNVKYSMSQIRQRMYYYKYVIVAALGSIGISESQVNFVEESSYHFSREWIIDQWRLCTLVPQQAVKSAWDRSYNPDMLSPMFCPGIQTLAEEHLDVDFQFGGTDQRGIFAFAEHYLPKLGYRERGHLMNTMISNLYGSKMSSSHPPKTKIMYLDDVHTVSDKINQAPCESLDLTKNGVLSLVKNILIPAAKLRLEARSKPCPKEANGATNGTHVLDGLSDTDGTNVDIHIHNPGDCSDSAGARCPIAKDELFLVKIGQTQRHFGSYDEVEDSLSDGSLEAHELKVAVARGLNHLLDYVRHAYKTHLEWQAVDKEAYPEEDG